jgi:hypothetical protein
MKLIHPIAQCYPDMSREEFAELRADIQRNGLLVPVVLFEDKILDGRHRERACEELRVKSRYETPEIKDPYAFVVSMNERRRQLNTAQKAVVADKMAKLKNGQRATPQGAAARIRPAAGSEATKKEAAKLVGVGTTSVGDVRYVKEHGIPEIYEALKDGKVKTYRAKEISKLPKAEQAAALEAELAGKRSAPAVTRKKTPPLAKSDKKELRGRVYYWEQWKAKEPEEVARLFSPSIFPVDGKIPAGNTSDEKFVRNAITELRKSEPLIPTLKTRQLDDLIYPYTQAVQTYVINRLDRPRPEGKLDSRFWEWARNVAKKMLIMKNFYMFFSQQKAREQVEKEEQQQPSAKLSLFDAHFNNFWNAQADHLQNFKSSEVPLLKERWLARIDKNFQIRAKRSKTEKSAAETAA